MYPARVAELADALDLGSSGVTRRSSTLLPRTTILKDRQERTYNKNAEWRCTEVGAPETWITIPKDVLTPRDFSTS